jgi:hypothetical protein
VHAGTHIAKHAVSDTAARFDTHLDTHLDTHVDTHVIDAPAAPAGRGSRRRRGTAGVFGAAKIFLSLA